MKEVLVVYYSQTGQLFDILKNLVSTVENATVNITYHEILPKERYEFPWPAKNFYNAFPESFLQIPEALETPNDGILKKKYDLVILGYQVWYLTPSIPINSFLKSDAAKTLLKDTPVVTVIGARNMWIMAQEKIKQLLLDCDAKLVGNIALVDRHINHISVITIVHWMLGGNKTKLWGIFPKPGVSDKDIRESDKFGIPIKNALQKGDFSTLQEQLVALGAAVIKPFLVTTDQRGNILFSKWANHIIKKGHKNSLTRQRWLVAFKYYLLFAIWIIAPIVFIVFLLTYLFNIKQIKRDKAYYSSVQTKMTS